MKNKLLVFSAICFIVAGFALKSIAQTSVPSDLPYNTSVTIPASNNVNKAMTALSSASSFDQIFLNPAAIAKGGRLDIASVSIQSGNLPLAMFKSVKIYITQDNSANEVLIASNNNVSKKSGNNLNLNKTVMADRSAAIGKIDQNSSIEQAIVGRVSGVQILPSGELRVRGINNLVDGSPLFIIDGTEKNTLKGINPNDIASVEVLKNYSETALYGVRGANGVFIIKTKTGNTTSEERSSAINNFVKGSTLRVRLEYVLRNPIVSETALAININLEQHQN